MSTLETVSFLRKRDVIQFFSPAYDENLLKTKSNIRKKIRQKSNLSSYSCLSCKKNISPPSKPLIKTLLPHPAV